VQTNYRRELQVLAWSSWHAAGEMMIIITSTRRHCERRRLQHSAMLLLLLMMMMMKMKMKMKMYVAEK